MHLKLLQFLGIATAAQLLVDILESSTGVWHMRSSGWIFLCVDAELDPSSSCGDVGQDVNSYLFVTFGIGHLLGLLHFALLYTSIRSTSKGVVKRKIHQEYKSAAKVETRVLGAIRNYKITQRLSKKLTTVVSLSTSFVFTQGIVKQYGKFCAFATGGNFWWGKVLALASSSDQGLWGMLVIKDRKWKEITGVFNFPPTATNASFVLRKYYISLLHRYEQVYFFGAQGQLVLSPSPLPAPSPVPHSVIDESANSPSDEAQPLLKKGKRNVATSTIGVDHTPSMGHPVSGVIDGKFEHGYLVTVSVGSDKLRGVLYHVPTSFSGEQCVQVPGYLNNDNAASGVRPRHRRRRKDEMKKKDPDHPKPNRSGYNFFFAEQHTRLKALHPGKDKEISKRIGDSWNNLAEEEKAVYQELGLKDKERYKNEMQEYRERQKLQSQDPGTSVATNEGSNQQLDIHSYPSEHHPDYHSSLEAKTEGNGSDMAQLPVKSSITDIVVSIKPEFYIQDSGCKKPILEE
eukprot:Gb_18463 [translate_table: standard]